MDFQADLAINKHALDHELLDQAKRMFRYSSAHAQAMLNRDKAKQGLDITKANLIQSIRAKAIADGEKMGAGGVTDSVVEARMKSSPTYIQAQEHYQNAEHEVQVLLGAVMAMNARRSMLENLVKLFLGQYWSEPRLEGRGFDAEISQNSTEQAIIQGLAPDQFHHSPEIKAQGPVYGPQDQGKTEMEKIRTEPMVQKPPAGIPMPPPRPTPKVKS